MLEALPEVLRQFPQVRLVIAGAGEEESPLRARIRALQLESVVQLPGQREDVPDLLQACDLFVFPSVEEGLGSTLIDAMLAERPIVTTSAGGILDLVGTPQEGQSEYAWIVEPARAGRTGRRRFSQRSPTPRSVPCRSRGPGARRELFTTDHMVDDDSARVPRCDPSAKGAIGNDE